MQWLLSPLGVIHGASIFPHIPPLFSVLFVKHKEMATGGAPGQVGDTVREGMGHNYVAMAEGSFLFLVCEGRAWD